MPRLSPGQTRTRSAEAKLAPLVLLVIVVAGGFFYLRQRDTQEQADPALPRAESPDPSKPALPQAAIQNARREKAAREALRKKGLLIVASAVEFDDEGNPTRKAATSVHFRGNPVDQETIDLIGQLDQVTSLHFGKTNIQDSHLATIASLPRLASLVLSDTPVTDEGIQHLKSAPRLEVIHLPGTKITDASAPALTAIRTLKILDLSRTAIGNSTLATLSTSMPPQLEWLLLSETNIDDQGLRRLRTLPALKRLTLHGLPDLGDSPNELRAAKPKLKIDR